jgi:PAS domain S-box-containing protein
MRPASCPASCPDAPDRSHSGGLAASVTVRHTVLAGCDGRRGVETVSTAASKGVRLVMRLQSLPAVEARTPERHVVDLGAHQRPAPPASPLARWSAAAAASHEACLVLDAHGHVVSLSAAATGLLGCSDVAVIGRPLLTVIDVVDFDTGASDPDYAGRVAPLAVLGGQGLMRSLLRVRHPDGSVLTLDASSAPLHDVHGGVVGSLTFLATLGG